MRSFFLFAFAAALAASGSAHPATAGKTGKTDNDSTFIKILGSPQQRELAFSMCAADDGNVYLAGRQGNNPVIAKITPLGEQLWMRRFQPLNPNEPVELVEIIEDSEGMLVLCGNQGASPALRKAIVFRYDPTAGALLWYKQFSTNRPQAVGILEKSPGGNFVLMNNIQVVVSGKPENRAESWEINRADGSLVASFGFAYGSALTGLGFSSITLNNGSLYTVGALGNGGAGDVVPLFIKMTPDKGLPEWALTTDPDSTDAAQQIVGHSDIAADANALIITGSGVNDVNGSQQSVYLYLEKHDESGALRWAKRYDISLTPEDVVVLPDAYVIFGWMTHNRWGLVKTDKNGNLLNTRILDLALPSNVFTVYPYRQSQVLVQAGHLLVLDHTEANGAGDIALLRTDLNLQLGGDCALLADTQVNSQDLRAKSIPYPGLSLSKDFPLPALVNSNAAIQSDSLEVSKLCPFIPCDDRPDISCRLDSVRCSATGGIVANIRTCNTGQAPATAGFNLTFYDKNPLTGAAKPLYSTFVPDQPGPGDCLQHTLPLDDALLPFSKIYALAGVGKDVQPPISPDSFPYPNGFTECDYANNLDSFDLALPPQTTLALGPDRSACTGQTVTLDAGAGYLFYQWLNGPATQTYTVGISGNYVAEVTDLCGRVQRDSVQVTVYPDVALTQTIQFHPGDTVTIDGKAYTQPGTVVQNLQTTAGCDSVVTTILERIVPPSEDPCDVKTPPGSCIRYELLNIQLDALGQRRYRVRLTNSCASPLRFAYLQLPDGVQAVSPKDGATYTAPGGRPYAVRNPNASPFHSIRFKPLAGSLSKGESDIFEYTLPQQSAPVFLHIAGKLEDGSSSEAHLNTFGCPVQPYTTNATANRAMEQEAYMLTGPLSLQVRPNPSKGLLFVDLSAGDDQPVLIQVLNTPGQLVWERRYVPDQTGIRLQLPDELAGGLYYLLVQPAGGPRAAVRFVLER